VPTVRLLTHNILLGGERREDRIAAVVRRSGAELVALQEVRDDGLLARIAGELGMTRLYGAASDGGELGLALLTRLPVVGYQNHLHPEMLRSHLEVTVRTEGGDPLRVHVLHLAARFGDRAKGEARRLSELEAVLADIAAEPHAPHLLVGDFNTLAPGDDLEATRFFRKMGVLRRAGLLVRQRDGWMAPAVDGSTGVSLDEVWLAQGVDPNLSAGVPALPWVVGPITALVPESRGVDRVLGRMIERWTVPRLLQAGYVDCFRRLHPRAHGYTCATWMPAARVDYVFSSPDLASRVVRCEVLHGRGRPGQEIAHASDHFPLIAEIEV